MKPSKNPILRVLRIVAGVLLLAFGLVALVTPLTPGAWLGLIGLELLGWGFLIPKKIREMMKEAMERIPFLRTKNELRNEEVKNEK